MLVVAECGKQGLPKCAHCSQTERDGEAEEENWPKLSFACHQ